MKRHLPPFAAVRAFEAAARHMSFKDAAEELCVTPSAVSHQIAALEAYLGTQLFLRDGNRLTLTRTGETYRDRLGQLLDGLDRSTRAVQDTRQSLRVLCTPGFAARWLIPRLGGAPGGDRMRLRVSDGAPSTDFASNDADVVIHWGDSPVPGVVVEPLMSSARYPAASREMIARENIRTPGDLARVRLLHDDVQDGWADWFTAARVAVPELPRGPSFPHCEFSTTAAEQGQGVTLAYDAVAGRTVRSGALVRLFDAVTIPSTIYSVAYPKQRRDDPEIRAFRDWLFEEVGSDGNLAPERPVLSLVR